MKVRTTPLFTEETVPAGLLASHQVADGVWGRLIVSEGAVIFSFDDELIERPISSGQSIVIPPNRAHHLKMNGRAAFAVEFYKPSAGLACSRVGDDEKTPVD